jgi:large repetitive protein
MINQPVTFTATVTSPFGSIPDGELVNFFDGASQIGTETTVGGVATFITSALSVKAHTIKAAYAGDATFKTSTGTVKQTVTLYPTTTTMTSAPNPSVFRQKVTFTATVTTTAHNPVTGTVTFKEGSKALGASRLDGSGVATLTKMNLTAGSHSITATYNGDALSGKSTSTIVVQVVN